MNTSQDKGENKGPPMFVENSSIEEVMNSFKSLKYATLAYSIRNGDTGSAKAWEQLPTFTFAATFSGARTKTRMVEYNGIIQLNSVKLEPEQAIRIKLSTGAILNIDGLDTVQRYDQETVKELFTTFNINIRTSADRPPRNFVRHASFFGTTNHLGILKDYTGSRRYLCHEVTGPINFDFSIDYKQLYAQAWNMIIKGFRYYFNTKENDIVEQHNQHYMETDADMELFYEYYRKPEGEEEGIYLSAAKLAEYIKSKTGIAISKKMIWKLGRNLKSLNFSFRKSRGITQYEVILR